MLMEPTPWIEENVSKHLIEAWKEKSQHIEVALCFIDMENFKRYTDFHGHTEGERCIKTVEDCVKTVLGDYEGIVGNLSSGGFVCYISNISSDAIAQFANDLNEVVKKLGLLFCWEQHSFQVAISLGGVHGFWDQFRDRDDMIAIAKEELMKAKMAGQNQVKIKFL